MDNPMDPLDRTIKEFLKKERELLENMEESAGERVPAALLRKVKALVPPGGSPLCPHCRKPITPFKKPPGRQRIENALWLSVALVSFGLSFVFKGYFMQFLVLTLFAGVKWIFDQKATKTQILIYKALQEEGSSTKDLHRVSSHL